MNEVSTAFTSMMLFGKVLRILSGDNLTRTQYSASCFKLGMCRYLAHVTIFSDFQAYMLNTSIRWIVRLRSFLLPEPKFSQKMIPIATAVTTYLHTALATQFKLVKGTLPAFCHLRMSCEHAFFIRW
jgi:hypothetical protein